MIGKLTMPLILKAIYFCFDYCTYDTAAFVVKGKRMLKNAPRELNTIFIMMLAFVHKRARA
jgi:hypothetical protein